MSHRSTSATRPTADGSCRSSGRTRPPASSALADALEIAARHPPTVDRADAGEWLAARLPEAQPGVGTIVHHSIVWQYLGQPTRDALRAAIRTAGDAATADAPLAWMRMEPAGRVTDLRITTWPGGRQQVLAHGGYHGQGVRSGPPR